MINKTYVTMIRNSDSRLTQGEWATFCTILGRVIRRLADKVHFLGHSNPDATWQNFCVVFEGPDTDEFREAITGRLAILADLNDQESIAFVTGDVAFAARQKEQRPVDAVQKAAHDEKQKQVTRFQAIESRISRIEEHLGLPPMPRPSFQPSEPAPANPASTEAETSTDSTGLSSQQPAESAPSASASQPSSASSANETGSTSPSSGSAASSSPPGF